MNHNGKIVTISSVKGGVGKTTLTLRFTGEAIPKNSMSTIGIDFKTKMVKLSNGKTVSVPTKDIDTFVQKGKMNEIDAIEMWLADNGHLDSEEQNALDEVAKKVKIDHKASADKPKKEQKPRKHAKNKLKKESF